MDQVDKTRQVVECGAAVRLDDTVLTHGIVFVHPDLPLFKLYLKIDTKKKIVSDYAFDMVKPDSPEVQRFAIYVRDPEEQGGGIVVPDDKVLVDPQGRPL